MIPDGVESGQPEVYVKDCPGGITGVWPTTPDPRTTSFLPLPSVMCQARVMSCTVSELSFMISTVYDQK